GGGRRGNAPRLPAENLAETLDRLWAREMTAPPGDEMRLLAVRTAYGARMGFSFSVRRGPAGYAGRVVSAPVARVIARVAGGRGDYLADTVRHLAALGIADASLQRLFNVVEPLIAATV